MIVDPSTLSSYPVRRTTTPGVGICPTFPYWQRLSFARDPQIEAATESIQRPDQLGLPIVGDTGATTGQSDQKDAAVVERQPGAGTGQISASTPQSTTDKDRKGSESHIVTVSGKELANLKRGLEGTADSTPSSSSAAAATAYAKLKARRLDERNADFALI